MAFYISAETADTLTLTPVAADQNFHRQLQRVFIVAGGLTTVFALSMLVGRWEEGPDFFNLVMGTMVFVGMLVANVGYSMQPNEAMGVAAFVFDRHLGAVRVGNQQGQPAEAYIAYADILDVSVRELSPDSYMSSSSGAGGAASYHAVVQLRDGGSWYLTRKSSPAEAQEQVDRLRAAVRAGSHAAQAAPPPQLPPQLTQSTQGRETTLRWRNPVTRPEAVLRLGRAVGMSWLMVVSSQFILHLVGMPNQPAPGVVYAVRGGVALLAILFVGWELWKMRRESNHSYALAFTPETVSYHEESLLTGQVTHHESSPLADWYGLSYSFDDKYGANEAMLRLTNSAHEYYLKQQQTTRSLRDRMALMRKENESRPLLLKQLSPVQHLAVVNWVQAEVRRLRG